MTREHAALCERLKKLSRTPVGQVQSVYGPHSINSGWTEFRRDVTDSAAEIERLSAENEAWDWLAKNESLELAFGYGPEPEDPGEWRVHERGGNINDREWTLISSGATPLEAVQAARTSKEPTND